MKDEIRHRPSGGGQDDAHQPAPWVRYPRRGQLHAVHALACRIHTKGGQQ